MSRFNIEYKHVTIYKIQEDDNCTAFKGIEQVNIKNITPGYQMF